MSAFTKGPWEVCDEPPNNYWYKGRTIYDADGKRRLCDTSIPGFGGEIALANAHLIAAAPDLYEVLAKFRESFYGSAEVTLDMDEIDKALAKARGEP